MNPPEITFIQWGEITINHGDKVYKDVKIWPTGCRQWDWNETGTRHVPGIQMSDIQELLDKGAEVLILSTGINNKLEIHPDTIKQLKKEEIKYYIKSTKKAVKLYNQLSKTIKIGALIHSTC